MTEDTVHAAVVESLKATASELNASPEMNPDWADRMAENLAAAGLLAASAPGTLGAQSRADDAGAFAAVALALGKVLGEIASMVGLNPDDGELEPILSRVRKLAQKGA